MGKQVWGTFSVNDHTKPDAFIADVLLYDRVVVPVPPDDAERARWEKEGWSPNRLDELLDILGNHAVRVKWDAYRQSAWRTRYDAGKGVAESTPDYAFASTRTELTSGLPPHVTGIQAVPSFSSLEEANIELGFRPASGVPLPGGAAVTILAHEFLVPADEGDRGGDECLKRAVEISSNPVYRRKRAAFWRWLREFLDDKNMCSHEAIEEAVMEMEDLLDEQRDLVRKAHGKTVAKYAFAIAGSAASYLAAGPATLAFAGSFISLGTFLADRFRTEPDGPREVALLYDVRKSFGWGNAP